MDFDVSFINRGHKLEKKANGGRCIFVRVYTRYDKLTRGQMIFLEKILVPPFLFKLSLA